MKAAATTAQPPFLKSIRIVAADVKLAHSVFALPFALLASFIAVAGGAESGGTEGIDWSRFIGQLGLIVICMIAARTVAMIANRLIDRRIDRDNPRTAGRAIPSGMLPAGRALAVLLMAAGVFVVSCAAFGMFFGNWWPTILSVPVLAWIAAYGFFKRFTAMCHLYLGSSLAISPLAAALAIDPHSLSTQPALWLMSAMVMCWVAGFDIIYALQDVEVDRAQGLFSMPARFSPRTALWISRTLHTFAVAFLFAVLVVDARLGVIFAVGVCLVAAILVGEHATVSRWGTTRIALTFFTLNGIISCILGTLGIVDVLI